MTRKNGIKKMINQKRLKKNFEHTPSQQALELNIAEPDITTTISNNAKEQPAASTKESFSKTSIHDLGEHKTSIQH